MSLSDECHMDTCRGFNCMALARRSEMVRTSKVPKRLGGLIDPRAKGYLCRDCARRRGWKGPEKS